MHFPFPSKSALYLTSISFINKPNLLVRVYRIFMIEHNAFFAHTCKNPKLRNYCRKSSFQITSFLLDWKKKLAAATDDKI